MELFGFINKKNYCYLFYVLGVISFLTAIVAFFVLVYILTTKQHFEFWSNALVVTVLNCVTAFENYILYSMCNKIIPV